MKIQTEKEELNKSATQSTKGSSSVKNSASYNINVQRTITQPIADDYDQRQQQLRIKYGSNKTK